MDKSRQQFEAWYTQDMKNRIWWYNNGNTKSDLLTNEDGCYIRTTVRQKWEAWQAGRKGVDNEN